MEWVYLTIIVLLFSLGVCANFVKDEMRIGPLLLQRKETESGKHTFVQFGWRRNKN